MLTPNLKTGKFTVEQRAPAGWELRLYQTLICLPDSTILVIGGEDTTKLDAVSQYSLALDVWRHNLPKLNEARRWAGGCFVNRHAYVVAGQGARWLNSIERLAMDAVSTGTDADRWELIQVSEDVLSPRIDSAVVQLNDTEFVIMGGVIMGTESIISSSTVTIFDTLTNKFLQIIGSGNNLAFKAEANQAAMVKQNKIVALVTVGEYPEY